jgi:hypothetical protein
MLRPQNHSYFHPVSYLSQAAENIHPQLSVEPPCFFVSCPSRRNLCCCFLRPGCSPWLPAPVHIPNRALRALRAGGGAGGQAGRRTYPTGTRPRCRVCLRTVPFRPQCALDLSLSLGLGFSSTRFCFSCGGKSGGRHSDPCLLRAVSVAKPPRDPWEVSFSLL